GFSAFALVSSVICFSGASSGDFILRKILCRHAHASAKSHMAKISLRFGLAFRVRRRLSSIQSAPRNATAHHGTARNRSPKSFRSPRPPGNRLLSPPRTGRPHSPLGRQAGALAPLRSTAHGDRDADPEEYSGPRRLRAHHVTHSPTPPMIHSAFALCPRICKNRRRSSAQGSDRRAT